MSSLSSVARAEAERMTPKAHVPIFGKHVPILHKGVRNTTAPDPAQKPFIDGFVGARGRAVERSGQLRADELSVGPSETSRRIEQHIVGRISNPSSYRFAVEYGCLVGADSGGVRDRRRLVPPDEYRPRRQAQGVTAACSRSRVNTAAPPRRVEARAGNGAPSHYRPWRACF